MFRPVFLGNKRGTDSYILGVIGSSMTLPGSAHGTQLKLNCIDAVLSNVGDNFSVDYNIIKLIIGGKV